MSLEKTKIYFVFFVLLFVNLLFSCNNKETDKIEKKEITTPIVVYAKVDKVTTTIGDTITYDLTLNKDPQIQATEPNIKNALSEFEILKEDKKSPKTIDDRVEQTFTYKFQIKNLGSYSIEPIEISYIVPKNLENKYGKSGVAKTSKIYLEVKSVLNPKDKNNDIDDIKNIDEITVISKTTIFLISFGVILVLVLIYFLIKKFLKPKPLPLPHEIAFKEFELLNSKNLLDSGDFKNFYFDLSEIVRKYLKNRFNIYALENTSELLQKEIMKQDEINKDQKIFITSFVETTDFYKFTDFKSSKEKALELFTLSKKFVDETKKLPENEEKKK